MKVNSAAQLYESFQAASVYYDRQSNLSREEYIAKLAVSATLYVGNLTIFTIEEQIFELFNRIGAGVKRLIMGRNKETGRAIGFCFIEYFTHDDAAIAQDYLNYLKLDDRVIRVDWDIGYSEGREYGRGQGGFQVRDAYRREIDPERPNIQNNRNLSRGKNRSQQRRFNDRKDSEEQSGDEGERRKKFKRDNNRENRGGSQNQRKRY